MQPTYKTNDDNRGYFGFTGPQRLNRAVHELEGMLLGVTADHRVNDREIARLSNWITDHSDFLGCRPFRETVDILQSAIADRVFTAEELADLLWMASRFKEENEYYCELTADMQRLQGILGGVIADGKVNKMELEALRDWMEHRQGIKGCWPYDEIESLITHVLKDGVISKDEQGALLVFFGEFSGDSKKRTVAIKDDLAEYGINGICAVAPNITFRGMTFCFTGASKKATRKQLAEHVTTRGGNFIDHLNRSVHYLIVGADGNPCWAFSCYGRKVEEAMNYRKEGGRILIVHEVDFWDHLN